jgi:hypothetical protein
MLRSIFENVAQQFIELLGIVTNFIFTVFAAFFVAENCALQTLSFAGRKRRENPYAISTILTRF